MNVQVVSSHWYLRAILVHLDVEACLCAGFNEDDIQVPGLAVALLDGHLPAARRQQMGQDGEPVLIGWSGCILLMGVQLWEAEPGDA